MAPEPFGKARKVVAYICLPWIEGNKTFVSVEERGTSRIKIN